MIPKSLLRRLAADPSLPEASRRAFEATLAFDDQIHLLREVYQSSRTPAVSLAPTPSILVFDCKGTESLPGTPVSDPGGSSDPTARRAYSTTKNLVKFYKDCFGRNSVDNKGKTLVSSIHFSNFYCNAYWEGNQMVYGDGDGMIFLDFTHSNDFIGHELTHGVTQYSAGLNYTDQPGALNESISDAFGSMFRQWEAGQHAGNADWMMGADLMGPTAASHGWKCVRDLSEPGAAHCLSPQPSDYAHYIPDGDPHDNSGIANHAFFLAATAVGGETWRTVGKVWYGALTSKSASSTMNFDDFANLTIKVAKALFAGDPKIASSVQHAWKAVGVIS
jgi:Zn-dependent metalloprotease